MYLSINGENIPQSVLNLNLLQPSWFNPILYVHAQIFVNFNYNRTLMDPPVIKVVL